MAWTLPDSGEGQSAIQSRLCQEYLDVLVAGLSGVDCVLSGCDVTAQGSPNMTVAVAKGAVLSNSVLKPVTAGNVTVTTAHATLPRLDLIVVNAAGTKAIRTGTAATSPRPPARTANDVVCAVVYVPAADTTISAAQITDLRILRTLGPITIAAITSPVTFNTTLAIQTYLSVVFPSGLLVAGRVARVRCGGTMLANSGTPTWTLTIAYGGTTLFADVSGTYGASAVRGGWLLTFDLIGRGSAVQSLVGGLFLPPATRAAPTTGSAGDLLAANASNATVLAGTAAVDSDAADRTLTVQWTMNVSNVAVETVMEFATVELVD